MPKTLRVLRQRLCPTCGKAAIYTALKQLKPIGKKVGKFTAAR